MIYNTIWIISVRQHSIVRKMGRAVVYPNSTSQPFAMPAPLRANGANGTVGGMDLSGRSVQHRKSHEREVTSVGFNCDGSYLAASGDASRTYIYDVSRVSHNVSKESLQYFTGHKDNIEGIKWHPSNPNIFATCSQDTKVNVYDMRAAGNFNGNGNGNGNSKSGGASGNSPIQSYVSEQPCLHLSWATDDHLLVTDQSDHIYKVDTREKSDDANKLSGGYKYGGNYLFNFACSSTKRGAIDRVYIARQGSILVCEWPSMEKKFVLEGHTQRCLSLAVDPLGEYFAMGSDDGCVSVWSAVSCCPVFMMDRINSEVRVLSYSADSRILAIAPSDNKAGGLHLTDSKNGHTLTKIETSDAVNSMHWHPKQNLLAYSLDRKSSRNSSPDASPAVNIWGYRSSSP